jgi:hypothetical protein
VILGFHFPSAYSTVAQDSKRQCLRRRFKKTPAMTGRSGAYETQKRFIGILKQS